MNRSILIVICDFIITSMIYLNGGFSAIESPFQDGGGATIDRSTVDLIVTRLEQQQVELENARKALLEASARAGKNEHQAKELERITGELANTRSKLEFMERRARLNRNDSGPMSASDLQKELEEEIRRKNQAQARAEQMQSELKSSLENLRRTDRSLSDAMKELASRSSSLEKTQNRLAQATGEAARLSERLSTREAELARSARDLTAVRTTLATVRTDAQNYRQKLNTAENDLAFLRGRSNAMEKELAATRDELTSSQKNIQIRDVELAAARTRLENMQSVLKNAVNDLSRTRSQLAGETAKRTQAQNDLAKLRGDYNAVSTKLQTAENKLRSDVLTRYSNAAVKVQHNIREKRLLLDHNDKGELYLPLTSINGKTYAVTALRTLTGSDSNSSLLSDVVELKYLASAADGKTASSVQQLKGPIYVANADCRIAFIEVPGRQVKPLEILTRDQLKARGIQDLYLFKVNSFGKDSTLLDSRCSMSFDSDDEYLYIRNGARVSSELKADIGDLVLTKQGELVGIVVALENFDFARQQEARCFVFNSLPEIGKLPVVPLTKPAGQQMYRDFSDKLNFFLEQARPLDNKKRHR